MSPSNEAAAIELANEIEAKRFEFYSTERERWPKKQPTFSDISECERADVLSITEWANRPSFPAEVRMKLEAGKRQELAVIRELMDLGYEIEQQQLHVSINGKDGQEICRGKIDGKINRNRQRIPFEVKYVEGYIIDGAEEGRDLDRWWWTKKWFWQMQGYLWATGEPCGVILLTDGRRWKLLPCQADAETGEWIYQRCEKVIAHAAAKTLPDFHANPAVCRRCWCYGRVCQPPMTFGDGMQTIDDPDLAQALEIRARTSKSRQEYETADKAIKERVKGMQQAVCGDWIMTRSEYATTRYAVPDEIKKQYATTAKASRLNIEPIKETVEK